MDAFSDKFGIMDFYLNVCDKAVIKACFKPDLRLLDVGKLDSLAEADCFYLSCLPMATFNKDLPK